MGETPNDHKRWLLDLIKTNRAFIKTLEKSRHIAPDITTEIIEESRKQIREWLNEMVELERWRRKEGYDPDQPYKPPSLIAYEKQLEADGELEAYMEYKATLQVEINRLEYEMWLKNNERKVENG